MKAVWEERRVGEILQLEYGKPLDEKNRKPNGLYPVYGANGEKDRTDKFYADKPSIIVGRKGSAGEINFTEPKFWPLDVTYFVKFDERQNDLHFLFYLLTSLELPKLAKGVKPGINRNEVYSQATKIPPLPEQRRIVGILDEAFEGIATAKASAEKNLQNARALFESYLEVVFSEHGAGWVEKPLGAFCSFENGDRGVNYPSKSARTATGIPFINAGHLAGDGIDLETMDYISRERFNLLSNGKIRQGDILFCLRGSLGKFASVGELSEGAIASSLVIVRPDETVLNEFVVSYFRSPLCSEMINLYKNGAAQPNLSAQSLRKFVVPVPPLPEQKLIIEKLTVLRDEIRHLESIYQEKLAALDELKQSLLYNAFNGDI